MLPWCFTATLFAILVTCHAVSNSFADSAERWDHGDLLNFVSRPDLTPPKLDILRHNKQKATPGYLFVAPYSSLDGDPGQTTYITQQIGPHIYDQDGGLIWSGAGLFRNKPVHDFKTTAINGVDHLTLVSPYGVSGLGPQAGAGFILGSAYNLVSNYTVAADDASLDMHEFSMLENGHMALVCGLRDRHVSKDGSSASKEKVVTEDFFQILDSISSEVLFEWYSLDHVPVHDSAFGGHDYFHLNSVDKTETGDFLLSARHTNSIFLVSGKDGSVLWRLGGPRSSFVLDGFNFSSQHDARIHSQNETVTVISFLDNAAHDISGAATSPSSSVLVVALHTATSPTVATLVRRYPRPDGEHTSARGNAQSLPNGHMLGGWSDNAYITEHTESGEVVFEAVFMSSRFVNYRTYKSNFTGRPSEPPTAKAFAQTTYKGDRTTAIHTSWNGATEVSRWRYWSWQHGRETILGTVTRSGFETSFVCHGYHPIVFAEALDVHGNSLGNSSLELTELPLGWDGGNVHRSPTGIDALYAVRDHTQAMVIFSFFAGGLSMSFSGKILQGWRRLPSWITLHKRYKQK